MTAIIPILFHLFFGFTCNLDEIRNTYHSVDTEEELEVFLSTLESCDNQAKTPFYASAVMQQAQFTFWVNKKFEYFNEGKEILETYIKQHPKSLDARYIRALIQHETPAMLGYKDNLKEDIAFIKSSLPTSDLPEKYKALIEKNLQKINA